MNIKLSKDIIFGAPIYELYVQALKIQTPGDGWSTLQYYTVG